jgi:hypothetical protein
MMRAAQARRPVSLGYRQRLSLRLRYQIRVQWPSQRPATDDWQRLMHRMSFGADPWAPDASGHIQAVGTDAAGRRQYRYHDSWREERDQAKYDHIREFGTALPRIREVIATRLGGRGAEP